MAGKHLLEEPHGAGAPVADEPEAVADVEEIQADLTDDADPTITAREGVGMAHEAGHDQDPASYLNG